MLTQEEISFCWQRRMEVFPRLYYEPFTARMHGRKVLVNLDNHQRLWRFVSEEEVARKTTGLTSPGPLYLAKSAEASYEFCCCFGMPSKELDFVKCRLAWCSSALWFRWRQEFDERRAIQFPVETEFRGYPIFQCRVHGRQRQAFLDILKRTFPIFVERAGIRDYVTSSILESVDFCYSAGLESPERQCVIELLLLASKNQREPNEKVSVRSFRR